MGAIAPVRQALTVLPAVAEMGVPSARLTAMNARVDHLLHEVLALPADERSAVAVALLESLEHADEATVSEAWRAEIRRRRAELHAGNIRAVPWAEVKQRFRSL